MHRKAFNLENDRISNERDVTERPMFRKVYLKKKRCIDQKSSKRSSRPGR